MDLADHVLMRTAAFAIVIFGVTTAQADPPGETPLVVPIVGDPIDPIGDAARQPLAERGLVFSTALTVPDGTVEASGRAAIGLGGVVDVSAGLGHNIELWLEAGDGEMNTQAIGLKYVVARGHRWQIAIEGSARRIAGSGLAYADGFAQSLESQGPGGVTDNVFATGATASACVDAHCYLLATIGTQLVYLSSNADGSDFNPLAIAGVSVGSHNLRGIVEMVVGENSMLFLGARYGRGVWAVEGGVAIGTDDQDYGFAPLVGVAARL